MATVNGSAHRADNSSRDAIAVIGIACRFPLDAENPEKFWDMLVHGRSAATEFPKHKFNIEAHYHPDPSHGGTMSTRKGNCLKQTGHEFDAPFFSISKTEALSMDPQQRLLMENVYEAVENAGLSIESFSGTETSVFVGAFTNDFSTILNMDPEMPAKYAPTGNSNSILSNRVSWFYDLRGCSLTLDTACSSSLVALHLACQNLRKGSSKMSLVGGVNVIENPQALYRMCGLGFLSPDGRCFSFDHRANGYSRGEGVGVVLLKPLQDALADGDVIRAVIRATGVNQDGRTPGMTLPSRTAQERLIREVYSSAGLDPADTDFVEAHGTGTPAGDPIEIAALTAAWKDRKREAPLYIGAVKSNIGHLEGASGVAGVIKTVLALEKAVIPPNINFEKINPKIALDEAKISFPLRAIPWPETHFRRASINSFGFGGTNAHVVIDDAYNFLRLRGLRGTHRSATHGPREKYLPLPESQSQDDKIEVEGKSNSDTELPNGTTSDEIGPNGVANGRSDLQSSSGMGDPDHSSVPLHAAHVTNGDLTDAKPGSVFVLSSSDDAGVKRTAKALADHLTALSDRGDAQPHHDYLDDLAYTLSHKRNFFSWKAHIVASSTKDLVKRLQLLNTTSKHTRKNTQLGFVFTGQGAQWPTMGRNLMVYPVFMESMRAASEFFERMQSPWNLLDELDKSPQNDLLDRPLLSQSACTALQVALVDLLTSWDVFPSRVIGHSSGEIAAAYCAGAITREAAWKVAYCRGLASLKLIDDHGAMVAVGMDTKAVEPYLHRVDAEIPGELTLACINSSRNLTFSGYEPKVDRLVELLAADKLFCKKLKVDVAYHSERMATVAADYLERLGDLAKPLDQRPKRPIAMFSTVTCNEVSVKTLATSEYWVKNMVSPVKFSEALLLMCSTPPEERRRLRVDQGSNAPIQHLIEIGPHPALQSASRETLAVDQSLSSIEYSCMMRRDASGIDDALDTAGRLWCTGYPVNLFAANHQRMRRMSSCQARNPEMLVDLPPYAFNHMLVFWPETRISKNFRFRKHPRLDLLGAPVTEWNPQHPEWRHIIRIQENPWLKDHRVSNRIVYPGVGYIVMALEAAQQLYESDREKTRGFRLRDVSFKVALQVPETDEGIETILSMPLAPESSVADSSTWRQFKIRSYNPSSNDWTENCRGLIRVDLDTRENPVVTSGHPADGDRQQQGAIEEVHRTCTTPFDMEKAYSELETVGLSFGPLFKNLSGVTQGVAGQQNEALGIVRVPDVAAVMPKQFIHPYLIHPTTMDSMLHVFLAAVASSNQESRLTEPMVPVFVRDIWVASDLNNDIGAQYISHGKAFKAAHKRFDGSISAWDLDTADLKVSLEELQFVPLPSSSISRRRQINFNIDWKPDVDMFDPTQCEAYLRDRVDTSKYDMESVLKLAEAFNLAAICHISKAMEDLKADDVQSSPQHLQRYYAWMQYQLERFSSGHIVHQRPQWKLVLRNSALRSKLLYEIEKTGPEGQLTNRMGSNIAKILRQEVDALQLMFGDDLLEAYYRELHGTDVIHQLCQGYLDIHSIKRADLSVLEVGAGTGGATLPVLQTLCPPDCQSRVSKYTFTDISPAFFEKAKPKLKPWLHMVEFRRLDIEKDLASQGFAEGQYDIVIASNVLHATEHLAVTLGNVRSLLKPGGKLLLHEIANPTLLSGSLSFGLLPGWWRGVEDYRRLWPILSETQWNEELKRAGMTGTDLVLKDHPDMRIHVQGLMISTCPAPRPLQQHPEETNIVVMHTKSQQNLTVEVGQALQSFGLPILHLAEDLVMNLENSELKNTIVVSLLELQDSIFKDIPEDLFRVMRRVMSRCAGLLWVTNDSSANPAVGLSTGLMRSIRWERDLDDSNLVSLAFEASDRSPSTIASEICRIFDYQFIKQTDQRHAEYQVTHDGIIMINRLNTSRYLDSFLVSRLGRPLAVPQAFRADPKRSLRLTTDTPGLLNRLHFADCPTFDTELDHHDVEVEMKATGLNFRDIMSAMGEVAGETLGAEGAGVITRIGDQVSAVAPGDRVVLLATRTGCFHSHARTVDAAVAKLPDEVSFESAAGLPVVACTAYYSLVELARLRRNETILIHAGAGGVGQVAIMLAKHIGADIFATVSTPEKAAILKDTYQIPENHILYSRDTSFSRDIMRLTSGRGVDVILNSLAGEALRASWDCIAPFGRFIEIGKRDIYSNGYLNMFPFSRNVTFASCDLETVMRLDQTRMASLIQDTMTLWKQGIFRETTPLNVFPYSQLESSFRLLQSGKHIGKIVLTAGQDDVVPVVPPALPKYRFPADATYLLSGGLGGLGRSIAKWMSSNGARHFIFLSRSGGNSDAAQELLKDLKSRGCDCRTYPCDVSNLTALQAIVKECSKTMPPIKGCVQGAMQLKDSAFETMVWDDFRAAILPKVHGSWNLHEVLPREMDFFIMLSSICGILGNRGQSNYSAGNTFQDALAHHRHRLGLPATAIDLGTMLSVGFIAEHAQTTNPYAAAAESIREDELHAILEYHMDPRHQDERQPQVAVGLTTRAAFQAKGVPEPSFLHHPLFTLLQSSSSLSATDAEEESFAAAREALRAAKSLDEASSTVLEMLVRRLASVMGIPAEDVDSSKPVHYYGVDSLVAVEFRNWLSKNLDAEMEVLDIMGDDSMAVLAEKIAKASKLVRAEVKGGGDGEAQDRGAGAGEGGNTAGKEHGAQDGEVKAETEAVVEGSPQDG